MPTKIQPEYNQMLTTPAVAETVGEPSVITAPADPVLSQWLKLSKRSTGETKVWTKWQPDPYQRKLDNGTVAGTLFQFNLSLNRVPSASGIVCFERFLFYITPNGWTNQSDKIYLHLFNQQGGPIDFWDLGYLDIQCGNPANKAQMFGKNVSPDWFDLAWSAQIYLGGGRYFKC